MYVPVLEVLTVPEVVIDDVIIPSTSSVAVAPGSIKVSPTVRLIDDSQVNIIIGGVLSGGVLTAMVLVTDAVLFPVSVTL